MSEAVCKRCVRKIENGVIYQCVRCFTEYCVRCEDSQEGRVCPKCGMGARLILQIPETKGKEK